MINKYINRFILSNPIVMARVNALEGPVTEAAIYGKIGDIFQEYIGYRISEKKIKTFILYIATKWNMSFGDVWFDDFIKFKYFFRFDANYIPWWYRIYLRIKNRGELL